MSGIVNSAGSRSGIIGVEVNPTQPAFLCVGDNGANYDLTDNYPYSTVNDIHGVWTVRYDQGGDIDTTSGRVIFTAPLTGRYLFTFFCKFENHTASDQIMHWLKTSNTEYWLEVDTDDLKRSSSFSVIADMDAGDTAQTRVINWTSARGNIIASTHWLSFSGCLIT
jgi:hypothetical protein